MNADPLANCPAWFPGSRMTSLPIALAMFCRCMASEFSLSAAFSWDWPRVEVPLVQRTSVASAERNSEVSGRRRSSVRSGKRLAGRRFCSEPDSKGESSNRPSSGGVVGDCQGIDGSIRRSVSASPELRWCCPRPGAVEGSGMPSGRSTLAFCCSHSPCEVKNGCASPVSEESF